MDEDTGDGATRNPAPVEPRAASHDPRRRTVLRAIGGLGLVGTAAAITGGRPLLAGAAGAAEARRSDPDVVRALRGGAVCDLTPESIEGPFYIPDEEVRDDIREDRQGVALRLRFHVMNANTCQPLKGAAVDIWHCDALGVYSGEALRAEGESSDDSTTFLRGIQLSAANGWCDFQTIVPGWYPGRATHIHTKVHVRGQVDDGHYVGGHVSHTGQIFFKESLMQTIETLPPYSGSTTRRLRNSEDAYYNQSGGSSALVKASSRLATLVRVSHALHVLRLYPLTHVRFSAAQFRLAESTAENDHQPNGTKTDSDD